jgi:hypothetical protein
VKASTIQWADIVKTISYCINQNISKNQIKVKAAVESKLLALKKTAVLLLHPSDKKELKLSLIASISYISQKNY